MLSSPLSLAIMFLSCCWISSCSLLESLRLCTSVLLVWFPGSGSVLDADTWEEVSFIGDVCDSTSLHCLDSGILVFL